MSNSFFMRYRLPLGAIALALLIVMIAGVSPALADPETGQSVNVVIIGGSTLDTNVPCGFGVAANTMYYTGGGCLPVTGAAGELGDFTFTAMLPADVSAASLAPYDTAVVSRTFCKMLFSLAFEVRMRSESVAAVVVVMWITRRVIQVRWEGMAFHRTIFPQRIRA